MATGRKRGMMKTIEEINEKLKEIKENTKMSNWTKNYYWKQALNWVMGIEE